MLSLNMDTSTLLVKLITNLTFAESAQFKIATKVNGTEETLLQ